METSFAMPPIKNKGGRPPGITSSRRISPDQRAKQINRILAQRERMPLDVMLDTMDYIFDLGRESLMQSKVVEDLDQKASLESRGLARCVEACAIAKDAAGYVHAKLAAVTLGGDKLNPIQMQAVAVRGMSDDDLAKMKVLLAKHVPNVIEQAVESSVIEAICDDE